MREAVLLALRSATRDWEGDFAFTAEWDPGCGEFDVTVTHEGLRASHRMSVRVDEFRVCELCFDGEDGWADLTAESLFAFMWFDLANLACCAEGPIAYMRGDNPTAAEAAEVVNRIIEALNTVVRENPHAKLYLGDRQRWAVSMVEAGEPFLKILEGFEVVWVCRESYVRCV